MKKTTKRALKLRRETVRQLRSVELVTAAAGDQVQDESKMPTCPWTQAQVDATKNG